MFVIFPAPISLVLLVICRLVNDGWIGNWHMQIIQRNVLLESVGAAVASGIRLWKAKAPTALHSDNVGLTEQNGDHASGLQEIGDAVI